MINHLNLRAYGLSFLERNRDAFLFSLFTILISFFGTMIYLQLSGAGDVAAMVQDSAAMKEEDFTEEDVTWKSVFIHNFMILLPACIGVFSFGFISFWYIIMQGCLLGASIFYLSKDLSFWLVFKYTFLHGVFEILAIALVGAFALKPAVVTFKCLAFKKRFLQKRDFKDMALMFVLYVSFLFVAALIEGLVTTRL
ncbi:stage II sporulation protein M [Siminovitchia sp. 179-K 8D1 HS]|uniref:stage II sporulation protein M n=1 Tax=Siminovitchia sp. 179-K 8D1 HS TaxID=3142385 RepID=UPI0039A21FFE